MRDAAVLARATGAAIVQREYDRFVDPYLGDVPAFFKDVAASYRGIRPLKDVYIK